MILALDVGNSQIYGGVYDQSKMKLSFRRNSKQGSSSDEVGIFLRSVLRENSIDPSLIKQIAFCSVVPDVIYSLKGACTKYFGVSPFVLQAGVKTGLNVRYRNPTEVGADRIANSIAVSKLYPGKNAIIVDLGTATTFDVLTSDRDYLGGSIIAGLKISMESLESRTSKLPTVEIIGPKETLGRTTIESIQSGLYFGHLGAIREICHRLATECFKGEKPFVVGTGGFSSLFENEKVFDQIVPDLVLKGLLHSLFLNSDSK
jgi:type III pantothenate kinase